MERTWLATIALLVWAAMGGAAEAQTITVTISSFEGRSAGTFDLADLATVAANPIGLDECDATIRFRFTNLDITRATLRFYQGSMCDDPTVRTTTTSTACIALPAPDVAIDGRSQRDVDILARDLVPCDDGGSGVETVWVLALNNETDAVTGAGQQVSFPVAYDFVGPGAPAGFTGSGGESSARLSWTAAGEQVSRYDVFLDPTGCTGGMVASPGLESDPPDESLIVATTAGTATSYSVAFPTSVPLGGEAAVAIRAVDRAGNVGPLSTPICVDRFEVTTWWDMYCGGATPSEVCTSGGGCAAAPRGSRARAWQTGLFVLVLAWLVVRRRSR